MLLIGCTLAEIPFKEVFTKEVYYYTFIRLFLIPVIVLAGCRLFHIDQLITAVCVILSAMPAASTSVVLAVKYGKDDRLATKIVVFSTVVSLITLPVWCYILTV
jgi:predicted permease